jgi:hypothetical protein
LHPGRDGLPFTRRKLLTRTRDVPGIFIANSDLATGYSAIPGQPVILVEAFVAWVQNGPGVVLAANEIVFNYPPDRVNITST